MSRPSPKNNPNRNQPGTLQNGRLRGFPPAHGDRKVLQIRWCQPQRRIQPFLELTGLKDPERIRKLLPPEAVPCRVFCSHKKTRTGGKRKQQHHRHRRADRPEPPSREYPHATSRASAAGPQLAARMESRRLTTSAPPDTVGARPKTACCFDNVKHI